jgi:Na+/H+ antiporter NhaD/arsenite permease-like protein
MPTLVSFARREPVLLIAAAAAAVSCLFVPPDAAYLRYFDLRTLALLYALMAVVSGLRTAGAFARLAHEACARARDTRSLGLLLTALSFFSAMLITNDVALLTFVPFAAALMGMAGRQRDLARVVVLQTAAANLGSKLTPVGSPQTLDLFAYYDFTAAAFFRVTFPVWALSLALLLLLCLGLPRRRSTVYLGQAPEVDARRIRVCLALLAVCLLAVFRVIGWPVMLLIVAAALWFFDRKMLRQADFALLATFAAFFVFAGNLGRLEAVDRLLTAALRGREYAAAVLASQVISNVPAALLLSGFTPEGREILLGVNIGGLGTPIASLASLISLKLYAATPGAQVGRYLLDFTVVNVLLLALLTAARLFI